MVEKQSVRDTCERCCVCGVNATYHSCIQSELQRRKSRVSRSRSNVACGVESSEVVLERFRVLSEFAALSYLTGFGLFALVPMSTALTVSV
jgi:hypothetical protein